MQQPEVIKIVNLIFLTAVQRRSVTGGTATEAVQAQLQQAQALLEG